MNEVTVRRLLINDINIARSIASSIMGQPEVDTDVLSELLDDARSIVLAALDHDEPVAYLTAYCFPSLDGERLAYLYDIEVLNAFRRRGVAKMLVGQLLAHCRHLGVQSIWVGSSLTNLAACELWRTTGAKRDGDQYVEFTYDLQ
jgi:ribosomal protein S18 acetylase RimI-like enzyme